VYKVFKYFNREADAMCVRACLNSCRPVWNVPINA
jgi:hypothetical protein